MNCRVRSMACAWIAVSTAALSGRIDRSDPARGFTIQQALSAPFPSDLKAAPAKGRLAWVFNSQGRRSIWVAEPGGHRTYTTRQLTNDSVDDGQDLIELAWSPEADSLAYVRGGDEEFSEKPYPNPAGIVTGVEQDVWVVSLQGGKPRQLGEGHSPAVSPTGDSVAYILKGQVWLGKLTGSDQPQQLIHARGTAHSLSWSPDGRLLAFVSDHGDHSFIGLFAMDTKSLTYVDPSTDRDRDPVWSPDGRRLAFLRIASTEDNLLFGPKRTGLPWSIRVYQVDSQQTGQIFKAPEGRGSVFREVAAQNQLLWGAGERIIFPWEKDGWTHLYAVSTGGGTPTLLTPGDFEVEYVSLSQDRNTVVYSSNQDDIDRRHIWKVSGDGKQQEALTQGTGIETAPVVVSDNQTVAVLRADPRLPLRPAILAGAQGIRDLAPQAIPADFPAAQMVSPQAVIFSAADGLEIHGQLFLPANPAARHPAIVFFHGGSRRQMLLGWHYMYYYSNAYAMNQFLASRGYVVLSVNYRSGIGYGLEFREALNYGATGASEYNDVQGAGMYLRSRGDVDPRRIGLWGGSYGGYLTALGLARSSDLFAAGVDLHGVHDWNTELTNFVPSYDPKAHADIARVAWESSPLASVRTWRSPVLLIHGDDDRNVPFAQTVALVEALRKQGVDFEELIFPDEIHDFLLYRNWVAAYSAAVNFFDRQLAASPAAVAVPPAAEKGSPGVSP